MSAWAAAKSQTNQWAADDILATATAWKTAQRSMRVARLMHKENARSALDKPTLSAVEASWETTLVAIKTGLGL